MEFFIVTRNPGNGRVLAATESPSEGDYDPPIAVFASYDEALATVAKVPVCAAWGWQIVELEEFR
jgi:hypothetical protein